MSSDTNERYIGGQVRSRANVILTRRDDLRVVQTKEQTDLDLHVYVDRESNGIQAGMLPLRSPVLVIQPPRTPATAPAAAS